MRRRLAPATNANDMKVRPKRMVIRAGLDQISREGNSLTGAQSDSDAWLAISSGPVVRDQEHNALRGPAGALALDGSHQTYLRR